jgi:hypothetical protein
MFAHGLSMHQKCSNYALTNLLFCLCKSVWIIDPFIICPTPIPELQHTPLPSKCYEPKNIPNSLFDAFPNSLIDSNVSLKWKQRKSKKLGTHSLVRSTLGVEGVLELRDETKKNDKHLIIHMDLHKTKQQVG